MTALRGFLNWITAPTLLHGLALGITASVLVAMAWQLALAQTIAVVLLAGAFLLLLGILVGSSVIRSQWQDVEAGGLNPLRSTSASILEALANPDANASQAKLIELLPKLASQAQTIGEAGLGLLLRFLAAGRLFALLGVTVSFAVFLAIYMQVERLSEQNSLVRLQALSAHQQIALAMRNEIATVASLATLAAELQGIYGSQSNATEEVGAGCKTADVEIEGVFLSILQGKTGLPADAKTCFQAISALLSARSENLQANRLLNQQVTGGSALRLNVFTRDLTEQFTTQFSSYCGTDAKLTADMGRRCEALNGFEDAIESFLNAASDTEREKTVHLSGTPDDNAIAETRKFLSLSGYDARTVAQVAEAVLRISVDTQQYLEAQRTACAARAMRLRTTLDRLDSKYDLMLDAQDRG
ncbi:MAG: hypothetical protein R3E87_03420 [Burkholderiaceae bacterium]